MIGKDFDQLVKGLECMEEAILLSKGKDYTQGDADRLKNFKRLGMELVPMLKSVMSRGINFIKDKDGNYVFDSRDMDMNVEIEFDEEALHKMGSLIVWWVYFRKHIDALASYVVTGRVESEGLTGRINDVRNYAALGAGLMVDFGDMPLPMNPLEVQQ